MNFKKFRTQFFDTFNFEIDGRLHYVYRITEIDTNMSYIGSRTCNRSIHDAYTTCTNDLKSYGTSSYRKEFIKANLDKFKFKILRIFDNSVDKILFESFIHQKFDVKHNNKFWNKSNHTPNGCDTTGRQFTHSEDHIKKRTESRSKTMLEVGEDGLNRYQRASIKANKTKLKKDKNGLSQYQKLAKKAWTTKKKKDLNLLQKIIHV